MSVTEKKADYVFLLYVGILLIFGLVMLASASSPVGYQRFGDNYFFIKRQLLYGVLPGIVAFLFFAKFDYRKLLRFATPIFGFSLLLLILVFIPGIGSNLNTGAHSWLVIGPISFQPAEFAKLAMVIFMSAFLVHKGHDLVELEQGFIPSLIVGFIPVLLVVLQPDVGTVSILFSLLFGLLFVAGAKYKHLLALALLGVVALIILIAVAPYRAARFTTFLHPELDPQGIGYHINQAFLAIGSGGVFGQGLGRSRQKFQYLPEVHADSIFAVIAEEMGFVFASLFILFLLLIAFRAFRIAKDAPISLVGCWCVVLLFGFWCSHFLILELWLALCH